MNTELSISKSRWLPNDESFLAEKHGRRTLAPRQIACGEQPQKNRVVIENGEVKMQLFTDTVDLEEARALLHEMVRLEYSLP